MLKKFFIAPLIIVLGMSIAFGAAVGNAEEGGEIKSLMEKAGITLGGFVDTSFSTNLNEPVDRQSRFRVYDTEADSFRLNTTHLFVGREGSGEGGALDRAGFYFSADIGKNADVNAPAGTRADDQIDFQEAYVTYLFPIGSGLTLTAGKFATLAAAELMNSTDNINFSTSFAFGLGPFTHTGVRLSYDVNSMVGVTLGVVNGWDNLDDNNDAKTLEAGIAFNPTDALSWNHSVYYGAEQDEVTSNQRFFYDTVLAYQLTSQLKFMTQIDFGTEQKNAEKRAALAVRETGVSFAPDVIVQDSAALLPGEGGKWNAFVGYLYYTPTDKLGFTIRGERFNDMDGARTGIDQVLYELTFTTSYYLTPSLLTRLEYRYDKSTQNVFGTDVAGELADNQSTIGAQLIYKF